jgi:hypothetical protein
MQRGLEVEWGKYIYCEHEVVPLKSTGGRDVCLSALSVLVRAVKTLPRIFMVEASLDILLSVQHFLFRAERGVGMDDGGGRDLILDSIM